MFQVETELKKISLLFYFFIQSHSKTKIHYFFVSFLWNLWSNDSYILWLCKNKNHCL